jgi:hypothetical protein
VKKLLLISLLYRIFLSAQVDEWQTNFTPEEFRLLSDGKCVTRTYNLVGKPWPQIHVFHQIEAEPIEAFAILADVERQKEYFSGVLESRILKKISPLDFEVKFIQSMPWPLSNEDYVVQNTASKLEGNPEGYRLSWKLLKATSLKESWGDASFISFQGRTLIRYNNLVVPGYEIASFPLVRKIGISQVEEAVTTLSRHVAATKKKNPFFLKNLSDYWKKLLL